jgi:osmoprotectant transport system permease protein
MPSSRGLFAWAFPEIDPPVYEAESFFLLFLSHAGLVALSSLISAACGIGLGIFVTRSCGGDFRPLVGTMATIGQTFPPVAVLAIAVPALGYGALPVLIALTIYGLLPIVENTIAGLESVPAPVKEAASGMGLSPAQRLIQVELPLAAATILAGIRISVIINIGTATIGSTIGAVTLGTPIIDGLIGDKLSYVLQGAVILGLFAIVTDLGFERLDRRLKRHQQGRER